MSPLLALLLLHRPAAASVGGCGDGTISGAEACDDGAEVDGDRLADKAVIGTEWWVVRGAMKAGVLSDEDIAATGFTYAQLLRTVVTHDEHYALG
jgi:hypothetical protein